MERVDGSGERVDGGGDWVDGVVVEGGSGREARHAGYDASEREGGPLVLPVGALAKKGGWEDRDTRGC